jgi:DNA-3-methyladenine glycosylase II
MSGTVFYIEPVPSFRLDLAVWALRRRPDNLIDRWDGRTYRRLLVLPPERANVSVSQLEPSKDAKLRVTLEGHSLGSSVKAAVMATLDRLLGLGIDLADFYQFASRHEKLAELTAPFLGMKPPRFASIFEALLNAIACQQVTLTLGIGLLNRLAGRYGMSLGVGEAEDYAFPRPEDLAPRSSAELRELGFSHQKGLAMIALSRSIVEGRLDLEALSQQPDEDAVRSLRELHGVGRWSAEYVLLRGLGRTHVFPGDDVGARNHLRRWLGLAKPLDYHGVQELLEPWKPYAGLIYFHLLLRQLQSTGVLGGVSAAS